MSKYHELVKQCAETMDEIRKNWQRGFILYDEYENECERCAHALATDIVAGMSAAPLTHSQDEV